ncbi:MAG: DNA repair protein RadC [Caldilineae bacterium]|nr:MAG: DNA repair protein RadC [Caldilineae bacterium]
MTYRTTQTRLLVRDLPLMDQPVYRLHRQGAAALSTAELLAAVLQTPDALALAQELLARFGGLAALVQAAPEELQAVPGIGPARAARLQAALVLGLRLLAEEHPDRPQVATPAEAAALLLPDMGRLPREELRTLLLDTRNRVRKVVTVYVGSVHTVTVRTCELFQEAVRLNCAGLILAHNHPSGDPSPSPEDVRFTEKSVEAGRLLQIQVLDHLILAGTRYVSLKEWGLGFH